MGVHFKILMLENEELIWITGQLLQMIYWKKNRQHWSYLINKWHDVVLILESASTFYDLELNMSRLWMV